MQMASSRFFYPLKRKIVHILLILLVFPLADCLADIGETHSMKERRNALLQELESLNADTSDSTSFSTMKAKHALQLQQQILLLDQQIFLSYDESLDRMAAQKIRNASNDKRAIYLAMVTSLLAFFFALMLLMARSRVMAGGSTGLRQLYQQLTMDLIGKVSSEKASSHKMLRVNIVVVFGLMVMCISVFAYLMASL